MKEKGIKESKKDGEEESETEFTVVKYLTQIPPVWDEAEKHGIASLIYDEDKVLEEKLESCQCCLLPVPDANA